MKDTVCSDKECKFVKSGFCSRCEDCPFYVESWWQSPDCSPHLVKDCFPKRSLLIQQETINRSLALQSANEQQRNEFNRIAEAFKAVLDNTIKLIPASCQKAGQIETKDNPI